MLIAATPDHLFHAYDAKTGKLLWQTTIDSGSYTTPMTYLGKNGKQYVVTVATGGSFFDITAVGTLCSPMLCREDCPGPKVMKVIEELMATGLGSATQPQAPDHCHRWRTSPRCRMVLGNQSCKNNAQYAMRSPWSLQSMRLAKSGNRW